MSRICEVSVEISLQYDICNEKNFVTVKAKNCAISGFTGTNGCFRFKHFDVRHPPRSSFAVFRKKLMKLRVNKLCRKQKSENCFVQTVLKPAAKNPVFGCNIN